jgi:hypothetical protein
MDTAERPFISQALTIAPENAAVAFGQDEQPPIYQRLD